MATRTSRYDVFISYASEDKEEVARPLAEQLARLGVTVWFDELELTVGDSLRRSIERGLSESSFGVVVLSRSFFDKEWPQKELDALVARDNGREKVILPVWHRVSRQDVAKASPLLADKLAASTSSGITTVAHQIKTAIDSACGAVESPPPPPMPIRILASVGTTSWLDPRGFFSYAIMVGLLSVFMFGIGWSYFMSAALEKPFVWVLPFGIIVGILFGVIMGPAAAAFGAIRRVSLESDDPVNTVGRIAMIMAELGYFGVSQGEGMATYKPSLMAGLLAGRITVRQHDRAIEVLGPRYYVWRLTSRLGARKA